MGQEKAPDVKDLATLLKTLTASQLAFVRERLVTTTDAEAARIVGVAPETASRWKAAGAPIDEIIWLARSDSVEVAREELRRLATKAVNVIEDEMDRKRGAKRLDAALAVLDRVGLVKAQSLDVTSGGKPLVMVNWDEYANDPD